MKYIQRTGKGLEVQPCGDGGYKILFNNEEVARCRNSRTAAAQARILLGYTEDYEIDLNDYLIAPETDEFQLKVPEQSKNAKKFQQKKMVKRGRAQDEEEEEEELDEEEEEDLDEEEMEEEEEEVPAPKKTVKKTTGKKAGSASKKPAGKKLVKRKK